MFDFQGIFISSGIYGFSMTDAAVEHMHADIESLKRDMSVIKHILSEEGKLSPWAEQALGEARETPDKEYVAHDILKKRVLK